MKAKMIGPGHRLLFVFVAGLMVTGSGQVSDSLALEGDRLDSLYIEEVEGASGPAKILHAEPLYIDLIRDLGARRGEREWNVGMGMVDHNTYDKYVALVEYEWAPVDRLGLEVELPFSFYYATAQPGSAPQSRLNSLKLAAQYSFLVSEEHHASMAAGYIHEFELTGFSRYGNEALLTGSISNPFLIAAKRWGQNLHTLFYTGPVVGMGFGNGHHGFGGWQANTSFHYMIDGTRNFVGIELNKSQYGGDFDMVVRPQMRLGVADNLLIGIVTGIPVKKENERFSTFLRLIYEPHHR